MRLGLMVVLLFALAPRIGSAQDNRGIYSYSHDVANQSCLMGQSVAGTNDLQQSLTLAQAGAPVVDGVTLVFDWQCIEPQAGEFYWETNPSNPYSPDAWIQRAAQAGKHINLAIRAGSGTPGWLGSETTLWHLSASAHQGLGTCLAVDMASPWDQAFLSEWQTMLAQLAAHLRSTPSDAGSASEYDSIGTVRIDGINRTTDELRLPAEVLEADAGCPAGAELNNVQVWLDAGYRPSRLLEAWRSLSDAIVANFGDKDINIAIIPVDIGLHPLDGNNQYPFPPIDEQGCVYTSAIPKAALGQFTGVCKNATVPVPDQNAALVELASRKFAGAPSRLSIEFENLHFSGGAPAAANPTVVEDALLEGSTPAYQSNLYNGSGASCGTVGQSGHRCTDAQYLELLSSGVGLDGGLGHHLHSELIEVFPADLLGGECTASTTPPQNGCGYPVETEQARQAILSPPLLQIDFAGADASTGYWYNQLPTGSVSASSALGFSIAMISCTGAGAASGAAGFSVTATAQGGPALLDCIAEDRAGNFGESIHALWIDTDPPTTTASELRFPNGAIVLSLDATDALSGVASTEYRINGGKWKMGTQLSFFKSGVYKVEFRSTDVAGNIEQVRSVRVVVSQCSRPLYYPCR